MRVLASKEYSNAGGSTGQYQDASVYNCGVLPSQYVAQKGGNGEEIHPPDLVDASSEKSLKGQTLKRNAAKGIKGGKGEIKAWDSTCRNQVAKSLWRIRESVK